MRIVLNGEAREVDDGTALDRILSDAGYPARGIAVALDGEVVPRASWGAVGLADGARVEVLSAVQGG